CGPIERPPQFRGARVAVVPPVRTHVQGRKLEVDSQVDAEPEEGFQPRIIIFDVIEVVAGTYHGHTYEPDCIEQGYEHMLHSVRRSPVARQKEGEHHCGEKCIPEPEAMPDPERKNAASSGNDELECVR